MMSSTRDEWRLMVTGGSGFIGTNLVSSASALGATVCNLDIAPPRDESQSALWQRGDVLDRHSVDDAVSSFRPTHVVQLAARTDLHGKSVSDYAPNVTGVENVVAAVRAAPSVERVVFASSRMVCHIEHRPAADDEYSPPNAYGRSKVESERIVRAANLEIPWTIIRPTSIWGPWFDTPYRDFFEAVRRRRFLQVRGRTVWKSFGYVGNAVDVIWRLMEAPAERVGRKTVYISDYEPIEVGDLARKIAGEFGVAPPRTAPEWSLSGVAYAGDLMRRIGWREPPLTRFRLHNLLTDMVFDSSALRSMIGDRLPYTVDDGVSSTVDWLKSGGAVRA
jgi:GlcNAc-P-P-Und epimerase